MAALVESNDSAAGKMAHHALPVVGVRAQAVEEKQRRSRHGAVRRPFQVVETHAAGLEVAFVHLRRV